MIAQFHTSTHAAKAPVWTSIPTVSVRTYASAEAPAGQRSPRAQPCHAQPSPTLPAQPASLESEELALRRRLLFRLLKGFDFDEPVLKYEPIAQAEHAPDLDAFEFNFESAV